MNVDIHMKLSKIFRNILKKEIEIQNNLQIDSIPDWDSVKRIMLMLNIEKEFNLKFLIQDVVDINTIEDLILLIEKYINK